MIVYIAEGEDSGEYREFKSLKEAEDFVKAVRVFDKKNNLSGERWFVYKEERREQVRKLPLL